jgi:GTP 3',8-cyclase
MARDTFGRRIDYLRLSVTDRCNLRCIYCMPAGGLAWKERSDLLTYEEIERFVTVAASEGVSRVRLTGGEPLVRRGIADLVRRLHSISGIQSVTLTTNGTLLPQLADGLVAAGLERINISLVSLDPLVYSRATRGGRLDDALAGIDAALAAGMSPVKINVVVMRSLQQDPLAFAKLTLDRPLHIRFIEYMPIGSEEDCSGGADVTGDWTRPERIPSDETMHRLALDGATAGLGRLEPADGSSPGGWGPAKYYRFEGARGTVGVISPLSHMFCAGCNRLRLTADGQLLTCLFSDEEMDARHALRHGSDADVRDLLLAAVAAKPESHNMRVGTPRRMSQVGG